MTIMTQMTMFLTPALSPKYRHNRHYRPGKTEEKYKSIFCLQNRERNSNRAGLGVRKTSTRWLGKEEFLFNKQNLALRELASVLKEFFRFALRTWFVFGKTTFSLSTEFAASYYHNRCSIILPVILASFILLHRSVRLQKQVALPLRQHRKRLENHFVFWFSSWYNSYDK